MPTNFMPRRTRSVLILSESGEDVFPVSYSTVLSVKVRIYSINAPNSLRMSRKTCAFLIAARILRSFRMMPLSFITVKAYRIRIKSVKRSAECVSLVQNAFPRQPCLKSLKNQKLEQFSVVRFGYTPFGVVIGDVVGVFFVTPCAAVLLCVIVHSSPPFVLDLLYVLSPDMSINVLERHIMLAFFHKKY